MKASPLLLLALLAAGPPPCRAKDPATTTLNEWPMIMAHDAATTYFPGGLLHPIYNWGKTQADGGAAGLLASGARALDWRPNLLGDGTVGMHHGPLNISHKMADSLDEMVAWAGHHGANDTAELVVLAISDCTGGLPGNCTAAVAELLAEKKVTAVNCEDLQVID